VEKKATEEKAAAEKKASDEKAAAEKKASDEKAAADAAPVVKEAGGTFGVIKGGESGGKVLPKETVSAETLDFLKKYKQ